MPANLTTKERKIDIIFVMDGTGSMSPCIDKIKANAIKFYKDFVDKMTNEYSSNVEELNIKVITFRDYGYDGKKSMEISEGWFEIIGGDDTLFEDHLKTIVAQGGGDDPENGLEALYYAMTSDWKANGDNDRQIIVLFSDTNALPLKNRAGNADYPENMVDEAGLLNTWMCLKPEFVGQSDFKLKERCKRLVMFAPAGTVYEKMQQEYNRSVFTPVKMDAGLRDIDFDDIIKIIAASASSV